MKTMQAVAAVITLATLVNMDRVSVVPVMARDRVATLLAQVRTALGGEERLAAAKSISAEGPFRRVTGARTVDSYVALLIVRPDKLRRSEESKFFGTTTERISTFDGTEAADETLRATGAGGEHGGFGHGGFDHGSAGGDHGAWDGDHQSSGQDQAEVGSAGGVLTEEQRNAARIRRLKMELQRWTIVFLADSNQPFTDAGRAESPDGPADVLETKDEAGRTVRYFIDPVSHMPLMVQYQEVRSQASAIPAAPVTQNHGDAARRRVEEMRAPGGLKTITVAVHLADYKKIDGLMLPQQINTSINGLASDAWTIDTFKINPKVKPNAFRKSTK